MSIIKEFCPSNRMCIVRTNTYAHNLAHLLALFVVAQKDFPGLKEEDVKVVYFAGRRYARTFGIEFKLEEDATSPKDYSEISSLEKTF